MDRNMSSDVGHLVSGQRRNAALSWALVGFLALAVVTSLVRGDLLWAGFALVVAVLTVLPPVLLRNRIAMLPWEVTALCALPILGRALSTVALYGQLATYLSVAAIALVVAVELHLFTPVRMTDSFAVALVVVATLAMAGLWAVARWSIDLTLGTTFLLDPALSEATIERQLMWEFVASTAAGVFAGLVFTLYVRRRIAPDVQFPEEVPR
jgi:hypothetical protein